MSCDEEAAGKERYLRVHNGPMVRGLSWFNSSRAGLFAFGPVTSDLLAKEVSFGEDEEDRQLLQQLMVK